MAIDNRRGLRRRPSNYKKRFFFLVGLVACGMGTLVYWATQNPIPVVNPINFCPEDDSLINRRITFLVDTTEPLAPSQVVDVQGRISEVVESMREFDMVEFYTIRADRISSVEAYEIQIDEKNSLDRFCAPQESNWELTPLQRNLIADLRNIVSDMFIDAVRTRKVQAFSPIANGLRYMAANNVRKIKHRDLYVISDMIENTPELSMYDRGWYKKYKRNQAAFANTRPQFQGDINVTIWALMRPQHNIQDADWASYWADMISGTRRVVNFRIEKITGEI